MTSKRHFGVDTKELQNIYTGLELEGQDGYLSVNYLERDHGVGSTDHLSRQII